MMLGLLGLADVPTEDLRALLRHVHSGEARCPLDAAEVARLGLQHRHEELMHLRGLDTPAVRAVLVAVLAERKAFERRLARASGQNG